MTNTFTTEFPQTIERDGFTLTATLEHDDTHGAPWDEEDGHGPVSDWRGKRYNGQYSKKPGELLLCDDNRSARFYDMQEACRIARRDGWGPPLPPAWQALIGTKGDASEIHREYRDAIGRRAYAAAAARADFERLRGWCNNEWSYIGVVVTVSRNGIELASASLWGIESDAGEYLVETANELAEEAIKQARDAIDALTERDNA